MSGKIVIVDDDTGMCEMLEAGLKRHGFAIHWFTSAEKALAAMEDMDVDAVLTDLNMRGMNGIELCSRIRENSPCLPVIIITAFGSMDTAIAAIRSGAYDFVTKPIDLDILKISLERAVQHHRLHRELQQLTDTINASQRFEQLVGESSVMQRLFKQLARVADTDASVLLTGESGTGKDLVARALHSRGQRANAPFVAINCSALPEPLLESELFGHKGGAFTGAKNDRRGLFLEADNGTLFLDEIGEMPLNLQPKLLRALEDRAVRPVGSNREIPFDTRIIAATNRDLEAAVKEGSFREDLFYRLNIIELELPPLRERGLDILLLARHFLTYFADRSGKEIDGFSDPVARRFLEYDWPGNVRELKNIVERCTALTRHRKIVVEDLPGKLRTVHGHGLPLPDGQEDLLPLAEMERRYIYHVLEAAGGNRAAAARILGLDRKTLYRKLQRYEEEPAVARNRD